MICILQANDRLLLILFKLFPLKPCLPPFILLHTNDADEAPDHTMGLEEKRSALTQSLVNIPKVIKISDFLDVQILIYTILAKKS